MRRLQEPSLSCRTLVGETRFGVTGGFMLGCSVSRVIDWMEELAPPALAEEWDRVGLHVGNPSRTVERILLALTVTPEVVEQAKSRGAHLILSHHPLLFRPLGAVRWDVPQGALVRSLIKADIHVYAAHTNFDAATRGTSIILADTLELVGEQVLVPAKGGGEGNGYGLVGTLPKPMAPMHFLEHVAKRLDITNLRHTGPLPRQVHRVAVMGGSGGSFLSQAVAAEVDAYVTGDIDFHDALDSRAYGLWVVDAGHFATERVVLRSWQRYLQQKASVEGVELEVLVAEEADPFRFTSFQS